MEISTTYGWPAVAQSYELVFLNMLTRATRLLTETPIKENRYAFASGDLDVGLIYAYPLSKTGVRSAPYTFPVNDPASLSTLRWSIRAALNDIEATDGVDVQYPSAPRWPDAEINLHVRDAIGLLNDYIPRDVVAEFDYAQISPVYMAQFSEVTDVAYHDGTFDDWRVLDRIVLRSAQNFRRYPKAQRTRYWSMEPDGSIKLHGYFQDNVRIRVSGLGPYPKPKRDDEPILVDRNDWDMISLYAQGRCYMRLAGQAAQLDRWKEDGKRNDNPILPIGRDLLRQAEQRMWDRRGPRVVRRFRG